MLGVPVSDEDPEGLQEPVGRQHLLARTQRHHPAREQKDLVVFDGLADVMGRGDQRGAALQLARERLLVALEPRRVEAGVRLVEEDEVGLVCQCLG